MVISGLQWKTCVYVCMDNCVAGAQEKKKQRHRRHKQVVMEETAFADKLGQTDFASFLFYIDATPRMAVVAMMTDYYQQPTTFDEETKKHTTWLLLLFLTTRMGGGERKYLLGLSVQVKPGNNQINVVYAHRKKKEIEINDKFRLKKRIQSVINFFFFLNEN